MSLLNKVWDWLFPEQEETCYMPATIPHGKVGEGQCTQHPLEQEKEESIRMTPKGIIVATVIFNEPMAHEDVVARLPNLDPNEVYYVLDELIDTGALVLDGDLIKEGNIFHDSPGNCQGLDQEQEKDPGPTQSN